MLTLHVLQGPDRGKRFPLPTHEPQLLGRSSESLPITDHTVSRRHAELTPDDGKWFVRDLDSANGTYLNGDRIRGRIELSPGDQIRCGSTLLLFAIDPDENNRGRMIELHDDETIEATVESRVDPSDESMIMAEPDPLRAAKHHLRVIYDLTALTASTVDRDTLLARVMDLIFREFKPERGFILLKESPEVPAVAAVVRYHTKPKTLDEGRIPVSQTIINHTLQKAEGILSTNAMSDTRFRSGDSVHQYGIRTAICVPIRAGSRTFGVIHIDSSLANFTYAESQLRLMNAIGQHTGLALMSTELVSTTMQQERLAAMGETVASLSHSIKNILQGLRGGADAVELAMNRDDLALAKEGWPILARNLDRIFALTLNMLAYSKEPSLDIDLSLPEPLIHEVVQLMQPQADSKRVGLLLDLAEDMPPIPIDANALHQALINLVMNAIDAVEPKRGVVTISTRFIPSRQEAQITVSDNGPGLARDQHEVVFQPFATTKGQRGTGLGLAVTKKIVEEHHGRVELQSKVGEGASFIITLPIDASMLDSAETRLPKPMSADEMGEEF